MKVTTIHKFYNVNITMTSIGSYALSECIAYCQQFCGGFVWAECETIDQPLPKYAKYIDTFYGVNVWFDSVTESFLFEDFN